MALKTLTSARTAIETVRGTAVTCTRLLYGETITWEQNVGTIVPKELRNSYFESFRAYPGLETNTLKVSGDVVYDDLSLWLSAAVKGGLTGTGASADKTWTFTPTAASDDLKSLTVEAAYTDLLSTVGWRMPGMMVDEFSMKWEKGSVVTFDASLMTHKAATQITAFTGSLTDRTSITALGTGTAVSIDTTTIGTTADANVMSVEWSVKNNLTPLNTLDGTAVATALYRPKPRQTQLKIVRYLANKTELDTFIAKTVRKVRVVTTGPSLGGSNYKITLDFYGVESEHKYAEVDDLITEQITLDGIYDATATTDYSLVVVNSLATIT